MNRIFGVTPDEAYELGYAWADAEQPRDCDTRFSDEDLQAAFYRGYDARQSERKVAA